MAASIGIFIGAVVVAELNETYVQSLSHPVGTNAIAPTKEMGIPKNIVVKRLPPNEHSRNNSKGSRLAILNQRIQSRHLNKFTGLTGLGRNKKSSRLCQICADFPSNAVTTPIDTNTQILGGCIAVVFPYRLRSETSHVQFVCGGNIRDGANIDPEIARPSGQFPIEGMYDDECALYAFPCGFTGLPQAVMRLFERQCESRNGDCRERGDDGGVFVDSYAVAPPPDGYDLSRTFWEGIAVMLILVGLNAGLKRIGRQINEDDKRQKRNAYCLPPMAS